MEYRIFDKKNPPKEAFELNVRTDQVTYLDSLDIILKAYQDLDTWKALSIHLDNSDKTMIGFAVIGICNGEAWIDDIMIDKQYQGKGYGTKALKDLIDELMFTYETNEVYLSCYKHNTHALNLYAKLGFITTNRLDINGELILVYKKAV